MYIYKLLAASMLTLLAVMGCDSGPTEPDSDETVGEEMEEAADDTGDAIDEAADDADEAIDEID